MPQNNSSYTIPYWRYFCRQNFCFENFLGQVVARQLNIFLHNISFFTLFFNTIHSYTKILLH